MNTLKGVTDKIRVHVTLTKPLSKQMVEARKLGYDDSTIVKSALVDYFEKIGVKA